MKKDGEKEGKEMETKYIRKKGPEGGDRKSSNSNDNNSNNKNHKNIIYTKQGVPHASLQLH